MRLSDTNLQIKTGLCV